MGRRIATAILVLLTLAACTKVGPTAVTHSPTPLQESPNPYPSPVSTFQPPTPGPSQPPARSMLLNCRLPISAGSPGSGGFIVFPGGKFVVDPASNVVIPNVPTPSAQGPGYYQPGNFFGLSYNRTYKRWLPVPRNFVTPDESRYVYTATDGVYVVSLAGGARAELGDGMGHGWTVLDVEREGVYTVAQQTTSQAPAGLWLLPFSGRPRQITATGYWQTVGGGAAYGLAAPQVPSGATQPLLKLDLKTGVVTSSFGSLPPNSGVVGFDLQGHPIVSLQTNPTQILVLTGADTSVAIYDGSVPNLYLGWGLFVDKNGIWLASGNGMFMWTGVVGQIEQVSAVSGPIAGPCV